MILYLVDTADDELKQLVELNSNVCVFSGYDKPRFASPMNGISGNLGMPLFKDYWYAPTHALTRSTSTTMLVDKFYSIVLVPVSSYISDPNSGSYMLGTSTHHSDPIQASAVTDSFVFDLPDLSEHHVIFQAGYISSGGEDYIADSSRDWDVDIWAGYSVLNTANGNTAEILSNTSDTLTIDSDLGIGQGSGYHIIKPAITGYEVYGAEMDFADDVSGAVWGLQGIIPVSQTQYELSNFLAISIPYNDANFPPDNYAVAETLENRVFAAGGVVDYEGDAIVSSASTSIFNAEYSGNEATTERTIIDTVGGWTADEYIGFYVVNPTTTQFDTIIDNEIDSVTHTDHIGVAPTDDFDIVDSTADETDVATDGSATTLVRDAAGWTDDIWAGYYVINTARGLISKIVSNTTDTLTLELNIIASSGTDYEIVQIAASGIVSTQSLTVTDSTQTFVAIVGRDVYLNGYGFALISSSTATSFTIAFDPTYVAGSYYLIEALSSYVTITETFKKATVAGTSGVLDRIVRFTINNAIDYFPDMRRGSVLNASLIHIDGTFYNFSLDGFIITNVATDGSWFEIINDDIDVGEVTMGVFDIKANYIIGNVSGENKTNFGYGMVGASIRFSGDAQAFSIAWVDPYTQTLGLRDEYVGVNSVSIEVSKYPLDFILQDFTTLSSTNYTNSMAAHAAYEADGAKDFTASMWFRSKDGATPYRVFTAGIWQGANEVVHISHESGADYDFRMSYDLGGTSVGYHLFYSPDPMKRNQLIDQGVWHHYIFSWIVGSRSRLWVDGEEQVYYTGYEAGFLGITCPKANTHVQFGSNYQFGRQEIGACAIYDYEPSDDDVVAMYNGTALSQPALQSWDMDEAAGDASYSNEDSHPLRAWMYDPADPLGYSNNRWSTVEVIGTDLLWNSDEAEVPPVVSNYDLAIINDYDLAWSDANYPHVFRTENSVAVSDRVIGISEYGGNLLLFCWNSIQKISLQTLGVLPSLVTSSVSCRAPNSVVKTPTGVFFFDGTGFSLTDGQTVYPVTSYKAKEYLLGINNGRSDNIRGVYDPVHRRVEYSFAHGSDNDNNFGLIIGIDSMNCYPTYRLDVNAMWLDRDDYGNQVVRHGTTNSVGDSLIWTHDESLGTDGGYSESWVGEIIGIDLDIISLEFGTDINDDLLNTVAGTPVLYMPMGGGSYIQAKASSVSEGADSTKAALIVDQDFDTSGWTAGDKVIFGGVPFDYGIKWTDFSSPQYKHKVRQLHVDITDFTGILVVEHYRDLVNTPVSVDTFLLNGTDTKIISKNEKGDCYEYGFRVYGVSLRRFGFHSFEVVFDVEV